MVAEEKIKIDSESSEIGLLTSLKRGFSEVSDSKDFIKELVSIELRAVYKKSFLGIFWVVFAPVFQVLIWLMLQLTGILNPGDTSVPYPIYVFFSLAIWNLFKGVYQTTSTTLTQQGSLLLTNKLSPRILVFARILVHLFQSSFPIVIAIGLLLFIDFDFKLSTILFPLFILPLFLLGISLGLVLAILRVVLIDFANIFDRGIDVLMFVSPVIFSKAIESSFLNSIIAINPLTYLIDYPRSLVFEGWSTPDIAFLLCTTASLLFFFFSYSFFNRRYNRVLEKLF